MIKSQSSSSKNLLLALAGVGILAALVLIGLGLFLFFSLDSTPAAATTPAPSATPTPVPATPTTMAGIVIMPSATPTPPPGETPKAQATDTLNRRPTATRIPTNTPTPTVVAQRRRAVTVDGFIELIAPPDDIQIASDTVEFQWRWHENKDCEQPPDGYAFEIRVWRDNDFSPPMGAMDAQIQKPNITCDPATGIRSFTIGRVKSVPGAEGLTGGRLRWDVALVQLSPYQPIITTQYRTFFY